MNLFFLIKSRINLNRYLLYIRIHVLFSGLEIEISYQLYAISYQHFRAYGFEINKPKGVFTTLNFELSTSSPISYQHIRAYGFKINKPKGMSTTLNFELSTSSALSILNKLVNS